MSISVWFLCDEPQPDHNLIWCHVNGCKQFFVLARQEKKSLLHFYLCNTPPKIVLDPNAIFSWRKTYWQCLESDFSNWDIPLHCSVVYFLQKWFMWQKKICKHLLLCRAWIRCPVGLWVFYQQSSPELPSHLCGHGLLSLRTSLEYPVGSKPLHPCNDFYLQCSLTPEKNHFVFFCDAYFILCGEAVLNQGIWRQRKR